MKYLVNNKINKMKNELNYEYFSILNNIIF